MKLGIEVDITIKDESGNYITIPVNPKEIVYKDGSGKYKTVDIIDVGSVDFFSGVELDTLSFSSFFPARYDPGYCRYTNLKTPIEYRNWFSDWKGCNTATNTGEAAKLQVIIPAAGINKTMRLYDFQWTFKGYEGDIYYSVVFKEFKDVLPITVSAGEVFVEEVREPEPVPEIVQEIAVGSTVHFKGGPVYKSSNEANPSSQRGEATCECTVVYSGAHPFHLISSSGDTVYGWVDADNCEVA